MATEPALAESLVAESLVAELTPFLGGLVEAGAALGWIEPPQPSEIGILVAALIDEASTADASIVLGRDDAQLIAFGCWRRYRRPTHRPHADIPYLAVSQNYRGRGIGGRVLDRLLACARERSIEQLTLDARGDNDSAHALWRSRGFVEYGRLVDFVAVGEGRYDKTFWVLDLRSTKRPSP
ncbi:MAG: GNAT family N-acetyltransferase [Actinomycetia bacterium]|nr:GNAT family N-acetyltransferase [Actinomycetes bacterium]